MAPLGRLGGQEDVTRHRKVDMQQERDTGGLTSPESSTRWRNVRVRSRACSPAFLGMRTTLNRCEQSREGAVKIAADGGGRGGSARLIRSGLAAIPWDSRGLLETRSWEFKWAWPRGGLACRARNHGDRGRARHGHSGRARGRCGRSGMNLTRGSCWAVSERGDVARWESLIDR